MNKISVSSCVMAATSYAMIAASSPHVYAATADVIKEGEETYADNCATCHGEQPNNTSNGVTFDLRKLKPDEHSRFVNSVLNGKNQMPPWRGVLQNDQIDDIWDYIRATVDK